MAIRLYAVTVHDGAPGGPPAGVTSVAFRELSALVAEVPYTRVQPDAADADRTREWLDAMAPRRALIPAPFGTVFRHRDALMRWMELHYVAISDALSYVDDRAAARVHVATKHGGEGDPAALADAVFRGLRRRAVASVNLGEVDGSLESCAFLIERDLWGAFQDAVREEQQRFPSLDLTITGPWAPFDFVRLQFSV